MTVTVTVAGNSESTVYLLDGTPSTKKFEGPNGPMETVYTSTWEGDVLVTTITAPGMHAIERRSIEADGTMRVQNTLRDDGRQACATAAARAGAGMVLSMWSTRWRESLRPTTANRGGVGGHPGPLRR